MFFNKCRACVDVIVKELENKNEKISKRALCHYEMFDKMRESLKENHHTCNKNKKKKKWEKKKEKCFCDFDN